MKTTSLKTLFVSSIISGVMLLPAQQSLADPLPAAFPNFNTQAPFPTTGWVAGQTPIAWGDCIPVPVNTMPFPQGNMPNMNMGAPSQPLPMMPFPMPPMANQQGNPANILPPPSPFFNSTPALTPLPIPPVPEVACNDSSKNELQALQAKYKQAASASKNKIEEITQSLNDANNQMADARMIIEKLSKENGASSVNTLADLKSQLTLLNNKNQSLQTELSRAKANDSNQALEDAKVKLLSLGKLQENQENNRISLHKELESAKATIKEQEKKLTILQENLSNKSTKITEENTLLKKQLTDLEDANKTLQAQLSAATNDASTQARKLTALGQSTTELAAIKTAYKASNDENAILKKQLEDFDNANKTLQAQLATASSNTSEQARKLTVLEQSATELMALKSAYKARNDEVALLKREQESLNEKLNSLQTAATLKSTQDNNTIDALNKKLADIDNANKTLKSQLATVSSDAGAQARKLTALGQSATELTALKSAYKARNNEVALLKREQESLNEKLNSLQTAATLKSTQDSNTIDALKKKLANFDNANKSLKTQLATNKASASAQTRKLTALGQSATELTALKSAYKARNDEVAELKLKLQGSQEFANTCKFEVAELKKKLFESGNNSKTLLGRIATLENTTASQARKITALAATSLELDGLKSAYKDLSSKKIELTSKLSAATADTDKDGVLDSVDKCPFSLTGVEVNAIGCLADSDNDGVSNSKDNCPESPIGSHVNAEGCPKIVDADGDAVADASDLCPATPTGTTVNEFGCAPTENITLKGVNFTTGSARLTASSLPILTAAADTLKQNPNLKIEIAGYTDNQGAGFINKRLSQRRANSVMIELIKNGVDANNLTAKGYGEKNPITSNRTANGRATNRRVELKIQK